MQLLNNYVSCSNTVKPVLRDLPMKDHPLLGDQLKFDIMVTFVINTSFERPPVIKDQFFMAEGVCQDRFHCSILLSSFIHVFLIPLYGLYNNNWSNMFTSIYIYRVEEFLNHCQKQIQLNFIGQYKSLQTDKDQ